MKWTKRTAALLAVLLLLALCVQAKGFSKASPQAARNVGLIRAEAQMPDSRKIPLLPVLPKEEALPEEEPIPQISLPQEEPGFEEPGFPDFQAEPPEDPSAPETPAVVTPSPAARPETPSAPRFPEAEDWQLLLVNPWNELPEDYDVTLKAMPDGMKVDERAYDSLSAMLRACRDEGLAPKICSAYRTQAKQTYLYNNKIARLMNAGYSKSAARKEAGRWVARPGTSEHQLGLAVDIVSTSYQGLTKKQERTAEQKWLMEHCWEYGFILRYPNDKSDITGIGYEPWHYRYVGVDVAQDIRASGLCLEEYLLLRQETLTEERTEPSGTEKWDIWDNRV